MVGQMGDEEARGFLETETTGRIGCNAEGMTYVVPVSFVLEGDFLYGHSTEGRKIRMMRANPEVCFEVDRVRAVNDWQSVIAWGRYEELAGDEALAAMDLLMRRLIDRPAGRAEHPSYPVRSTDPRRPNPGGIWIVLYRIRLTKMQGRFERP